MEVDFMNDLKMKLIQHLNLKHLTPETLNENEMLFGSEIGLDSIDALEIIVMLENEYGVKITDPEKAKEVFYSVSTLADYIQKETNE